METALETLLKCPGFCVSVAPVEGGELIRGDQAHLRVCRRLLKRQAPWLRLQDVAGGIMVTKG